METRSAKMLLILSAASDKVGNKNKPERGRPAKKVRIVKNIEISNKNTWY